jgi:UDP-glucose 4-epimerase
MKVLVTGGAGYLGTGLVEKLANAEEVKSIVIYDNLSRGNRNFFLGNSNFSGKVSFVLGDLLDSRNLKKALVGIDVVYHLAAKVTTPFADQNAHLFEQVNHWGTAELVYALEESDVKKFIHVSSVSVYGTSSEKLEVDSPLNPKTFYGISKMRAEEHVRRLAKKMDTYIIRCGNVYGYSKSMRFDAVINKFMFDAHFTNQITINGSGEQKRPFVSIEKVSHTLTALVANSVKCGTYNLVGSNWAIGQVVENLRKVYPHLEMLFVNQHMKMRELQAIPSNDLDSLFQESISLQEELEGFRNSFSY